MKFDEFKTNYELIFSEPKTINSGESNVFFEQRSVSLKNKTTGQIIQTPVNVGKGSESIAEDLVWEWLSKK